MDSSQNKIGRPDTADGLILEGWAQGFMVGSLVIMASITIANMRRHLLLHKLILAEVHIYLHFVSSPNTSHLPPFTSTKLFFHSVVSYLAVWNGK